MRIEFELSDLTLGIRFKWMALYQSMTMVDKEDAWLETTYKNCLAINVLFFTFYIPLWKFTKEQ